MSAACEIPTSVDYDELIARLKSHDAEREMQRAEDLPKRGPGEVVPFPAERIVRLIRHGQVVKKRAAKGINK
jgi:hypothetical protein